MYDKNITLCKIQNRKFKQNKQLFQNTIKGVVPQNAFELLVNRTFFLFIDIYYI